MNDNGVEIKASAYYVCDRCVFCGAPVPEGVMVCPICDSMQDEEIESAKNKCAKKESRVNKKARKIK